MWAGWGFASAVTEAELAQALAEALGRVDGALQDVAAVAVPADRKGQTAAARAAAGLGLALVVVPAAALAAASERTLTHSARSVAAIGVPSAAEAAALAAAGPGARLLGPRVCVGLATCALASPRP